MNKMKVALVVLTTMASLSSLQTTTLERLGNLVIYERANIFVGKILPSQYIKIKKAVEKLCHCRFLCLTMKKCSSASWLEMANDSTSFCLISHDYFSYLNLIDPTTDDYVNYFDITGQNTKALSCVTFHWFRDDYRESGKHYKVHHVAVKFPLARNACKSEGGRLATLETEQKIQEVASLSKISAEGTYWIGLHRNGSGQPPMWQYINGAREASKDCIREDGDKNCFTLNYSASQDWFFKDTNCGTNLSFVYERNF